MALLGLRLGDNPQACFTTTPRPTKLIKRLVNEATVTHATTYDNPHLPAAFRDEIINRYSRNIASAPGAAGADHRRRARRAVDPRHARRHARIERS